MYYSHLYEASELKYELSILKKETTDVDLTIESLSDTVFTYNEVEYYVGIKGLQFHRKVYEPSHITTELIFTLKVQKNNSNKPILTAEELKKILVGHKVKFTVCPKKKVSQKYVAENYYVHEICPQVMYDSFTTHIFVKVEIFSMDHLMTLDKYSKAYIIKKLGSGILRAESKKFKLNSEIVKVYHDNMRCLRYEENEVVQDPDNVTNSISISIPTEYIQPYLVQYNETFYEFLARTANRCGEFLFFEDGVLTLGMPKDGGDAANATKIEGYRSVTYPKLSNSPLEVKLFARDSIKGGTYRNDLNDSEIEVDDVTKFADDTFAKDLSYNFELSHDEYLFPLFKDKFADFNSVYGHKTDYDSAQKILMEIASESLSFDDNLPEKRIINFFKELALKYGKKCADTAISVNKLNDKGNDAWFNSPTYKMNSQQNNKSKLMPFSTINEDGWFKLTKYSELRKKEEEQRGKIVCIDMGANYLPVKIGQIITIDKMGDTTYVVVEVKQSISSKEASHTYLKYEDEGMAQLTGGEQSQLIFAIPLYKEEGSTTTEIVPPLRSEPYFRKSGPQTAFVVDNADPKSQGRVRIAFPWQTVENKGDETYRKALQDNIKQKEKYYNVSYSRLMLYFQKCLWQKQLTEELEKIKKDYLNDSKQNQEKAIETYKAIIDGKLEKVKEEVDNINSELDEKTVNSVAYKIIELQSEISKETDTTKKKKLQSDLDDLLATKYYYEQILPDKESYQKYLENLQKILNEYKNKGTETFADFINRKIKDSKAAEEEMTKQMSKALDEALTAIQEYNIAKEEYDKTQENWKGHLIEVASPWVRVTSPMATYEGGVQFKPNPGDEVLVNFDNDNVERPYVAGSLYSKEHIDPKEEMVIKAPSGQKISFKVAHDGWDFLQGVNPLLKTLQTYIPEAKGKGTLQSEIRKMAGDITMKDEYGMFEVSMSSGKRAVNIKSPFGNVNIGAFTGINITAPHGDIKIKGKNVTIEAGNNLTLLSGTNVYDKERNVAKSLGESFSKLGADTLFMLTPELKGGKVVDITLLRCFFDVLLRPVEGTLCVKSKNYLKLEAGKGKAEIPLNRYDLKSSKSGNDEIFYAKVTLYIKKINQIVTQFCSEYDQLWQDAYLAQLAYETNLGKIWGGNPQPEFKKIAFQLGSNPFKKYTDPSPTFDYASTFTTANLKAFPIDQSGINLTDATKAIEYIRDDADSYGEAISKLHKKALDFNRLFENVKKNINQDLFRRDIHGASEWIDICFETAVINGAEGLTKFSTQWNTRFVDAGNQNGPTAEFLQTSTHPNDELNKPLWIKRKLVLEFLLKLQTNDKNMENQYLQYNPIAFQHMADEASVNNLWTQVSQIKRPEMNADLHRFVEAFGFSKTWKPLVYDSWPWNDQSGKIIFSESKDVTFNFNRDNIEKWDLACIGNEQQLIDALTSIQ